jgi:hypothetical protein
VAASDTVAANTEHDMTTLLMRDFIIHLGDIALSDFGLEQNLATYPVILKLAAVAMQCRQNV